MKDFFRKHHRVIFYGSWLLLGLIQSSYTQLEDDEAYYWVCSKFLDWGYFDHPPMIALMIKAGYSLFHSELGVRLLSLAANIGTVFIIEKLIRPRNYFLFYAIVLSVGIIQTSAFLAVPDAPLVFFTALFFLVYKNFTEDATVRNTIFLGIVIALLFYSKYHGVLVVGFTVLSNPRLFRRPPFYIASLISLVLYMPHLLWQYHHGWPSVQYHLFERTAPAYKISFTLEYIIGQVLITGPIAGLILVPSALRYNASTPVEKALRYSIIGIFVFFLLSTFRNRVEANWTAPAVIPIMVLAYAFLAEKKSLRSLLFKTLPFTLALVFLVRLAMIFDFLPFRIIKTRYHSWKDWPAQLREKTKGLPIVFNNSHQRASKYWFYTGVMAYSQQEYKERRSNYNFWPIEDSLLGKPVYYVDVPKPYRFSDFLDTPLGNFGYRYDSSFASFAKINIRVSQEAIRIKNAEPFRLDMRGEVPENYARFISDHQFSNDTTRIGIFNKNGWVKDLYIPIRLAQWAEGKMFSIDFNPGLPSGKYFLRLAINTGIYNPTFNSRKIPLIIE